MAWTPFHDELRQGAKRGLPRAVRFIFLELSLACRKGRGSVRLPVGMDDVDAVQDLLGGRRSEIEEALQMLTVPLPGEEDGQPMIVLDGPERARTIRIPCWSRWVGNKETPGASAIRMRRMRERVAGRDAPDHQDSGTYVRHIPSRYDFCDGGDRHVTIAEIEVEEKEISLEPLARGSEASMPPGALGARAGVDGGEAIEGDRGAASAGLDPERLAAALSHPVFASLHRDGWIDDLVGRLAGVGVLLDDVLVAAEDFALKRAGDGIGGADLVRALSGYVGQAKRRRQANAAKGGPLGEHERLGLDLWCTLWSKAHGGKQYPVCARDHGYIRTITARARGRARAASGSVRLGDVLKHYFAGYMAIDDKSLVKKRYPLSLLESQLPAIGEYEAPRAKPTAQTVAAAPVDAATVASEPLPDLSEMLAAERAKAGDKLIRRVRA